MTDEEERLAFWLAAALEDPTTCAEMRADIAAWLESVQDHHTLRDLARKIDSLARGHMAFSQAHEIVRSCTDHLNAVARCNEINQREHHANKS
jgi:hypothetical protein